MDRNRPKPWLLKDQLALFEKYAPVIGATHRSIARGIDPVSFDGHQSDEELLYARSPRERTEELHLIADDDMDRDFKRKERHLKFVRMRSRRANRGVSSPSKSQTATRTTTEADGDKLYTHVVDVRRIIPSTDRHGGSPPKRDISVPPIQLTTVSSPDDSNRTNTGVRNEWYLVDESPSYSPRTDDGNAIADFTDVMSLQPHSAERRQIPRRNTVPTSREISRRYNQTLEAGSSRDVTSSSKKMLSNLILLAPSDDSESETYNDTARLKDRQQEHTARKSAKIRKGNAPRDFPYNIIDLLNYDPFKKNKILMNENSAFVLTNDVMNSGVLDIPPRTMKKYSAQKDLLEGGFAKELTHELTVVLQTKLKEQYNRMYRNMSNEERRHQKDLERMRNAFEDKLFDALFKYEEARKELAHLSRIEELLDSERRKSKDLERRLVDYNNMITELSKLRKENEALTRARDSVPVNGNRMELESENAMLRKKLHEANLNIEKLRGPLKHRTSKEDESIRGWHRGFNDNGAGLQDEITINEYLMTNKIVEHAGAEVIALEDDNSIKAPRLGALTHRMNDHLSRVRVQEKQFSRAGRVLAEHKRQREQEEIGSPELPSNFAASEDEGLSTAAHDHNYTVAGSDDIHTSGHSDQHHDEHLSSQMLQQFKDILTCPRCCQRARHPCIVFDCEHNYCRECAKIMTIQYHASCLACDCQNKHENPINNLVVLSLVKHVLVKTELKLDLIHAEKDRGKRG